MKKSNVSKKVSDATIKKIVSDDSISKSGRMKLLFDHGLSVKDITSLMDVRYNFVYNVISNYVNMNGITVEKVKQGNSKKDQILELFNQGKSNKDIAITLKTNYNYVFNVIKQHKQSIDQKESN